MPTAESASGEPDVTRRRWSWAALALLLLGGLGLRLWGIRQGLPYAYNLDEDTHFVPHAVAMFGGGLNPHYFANPPAFTYVLHFLFAVSYGGGAGVREALRSHPEELYTLARVAAALLGTLALWLLYVVGARLFDRGVALLAAAIEAVAFLPVFYSHLALNDVPTLAPLTLSLLGTAGVLRRGRARDYLIAGVGLGLACASKYTAGIVVLPLGAAAASAYLDGGEGRARRVLTGLGLAGAGALGAFLLANPYALLDYSHFHAELVHQSSLSAEAQGKLGAPRDGGLLYYLWSLTWGLGWIPALAALGGALSVWRVARRLGWLLVPAPLLFLAFMGLQGRYFGRWLLPIFPILCLLGAFFAVRLARAAGRALVVRRSRPRLLAPGLTALIVFAVLGQGLLYSVHSGLVLSRADTRNLTRQWMLANVPAGTPIVAEPVSPNEWARETPPIPGGREFRWHKYASLFSRVAADGKISPRALRQVGIENYVTTLRPQLIDYYVRNGYCWVISGSTQSARAFADPAAAPGAVAYYRRLAAVATVAQRFSPYGAGRAPVSFNFDWSFDYYPLAYVRPGPDMTVYRLHGGRCG
ncbi:MAG TPA: glycosyltransferase family 39 protein [Solirubrobacteraceae bacterium]